MAFLDREYKLGDDQTMETGYLSEATLRTAAIQKKYFELIDCSGNYSIAAPISGYSPGRQGHPEFAIVDEPKLRLYKISRFKCLNHFSSSNPDIWNVTEATESVLHFIEIGFWGEKSFNELIELQKDALLEGGKSFFDIESLKIEAPKRVRMHVERVKFEEQEFDTTLRRVKYIDGIKYEILKDGSLKKLHE